MAGNRVQYIIDLVVQDKQLRQQMSQINWEKIIGSKGKGMSDAFAKGTADAAKQIKNTFRGLDINWSQILGTKDLGRLEQQMAKVLSGSKNQIKAFAAMDDTSGIQRTVEYVSALGDELKDLGSSFDAAQLARGMSSFMKVLTPLSAKIDALAKEPAKVEAAFDRLFSGTVAGATNTVKSSEKIINVMAKIDSATKRSGGSQATLDKLIKKFDELKNIKLPDLSSLSLEQLDDEAEKLEQKLDELDKRFAGKKRSGAYQLEYGKLLAEERNIARAHSALTSISDDDYIASIDKQLKQISSLFERSIAKLKEDISSDTFAQEISKQLSDIKINLSLDEKAKANFINEINTFVKDINKTPFEKVKIDIGQALDDSANIIENKSKQAYGDNPADDDVNTTKLISQTEKRFKGIRGVMYKNQNKILQQTKEWRKQMLDQFKFKGGDFEFKFNDTLIEELQSLFDDYSLKINIDPQHLTDQIKTVLNGSGGTIGGGVTNIDASSMASAITMGLRAALTGEIPQVVMDTSSSNVSEDTPQQVDHVATEIEQTGRHLDLAEDYVKDVVEKLKAVAKYAAKDSKGSIATRGKFDTLGIDLHKVKNAADVGNDAEIAKMIEQSLLQRDKFGKLTGSTVIDELSKFKDSSSKTIPAFLASMDEVFFMLQENTQTVEEWTKRRHNKEIFDSARDKAKAASGLRDVRSTIRQGDIPNIQSIEIAISLMSDIGQNTDDLQTLKSAREALGDKTDDASIEEFKTAADTFYKSSTKTFWDLKKQAEDTFKGTIYLQGKNGKTSSRNIDSYKQLASIKDDAVIVDVQVSSSLNNAALGTVKSKYSNRASEAEEKRLIRDATRPDFIIPREYEKDILNKELKYTGFKPQGVSTQVDLDASLEANEKKKQSLMTEIQTKEEEKKSLDTEISILDQRIEDLTAKNKTISQKRKDKAREKVSDFEATQQQLSHEIFMLEEKVGNGKTGEEQKIGSLTKNIEEQLSKRVSAEKQLTQISELDVERKKKEFGIKVSELEAELPKLQENLTKAQSRYSIAESDRVMAQIDVNKASVALKAIPNTKKNEIARAEAENTLNRARFALADATEKVNAASMDVDSATKSIEINEKQILNLKTKISETTIDSIREEQLNRIRAINDVITSLENEFQTLMTQKNAKEASLAQINKELEKSRNVVALKTERELDSAISERDKLNKQKTTADNVIKDNQSSIESLEQANKRIEAEKEYNGLLEKSLTLQGSIEKMTADEADEKVLKRKQKELDKINVKLAEAKAKVDALGGLLGQGNEKEYSDSARKTYALDELKKIEDDLITARAQKRVSESRISKKDREIADLDKWGLGAGIGASELGRTKGRLTSEFMSGDYVQSQVNALREKTKAAIAEAENESRVIFDKKVAVAMEHLNWNPSDQTQVQKFLNTKHGQQLSSDFASEVDVNTTNMWKQYDEYRKDLLTKLKTEFQNSFKTDKGVLTATSKVQDETRQWINEIVEVRVQEALKARLEEEKKILEAKHEPIQGNIDRLEADKATAIEYGGVSDKELLSGKIIEDQIRKEERLEKLKEKRAEVQQKLNDLENAGIDHSDDTYKSTKKDLKSFDQEIARYEMLIKNRQKLVQMRYDESKEPTYTDEEKELHFTNQIVSYNEKIESSLAKQKTLKEQIASATGDDKTKLERQLSIEEDNVTKWSEKIPTFENKLSRLQASKSQGTIGGILPEGGIVGSIVSAVSEAIGSLGAGVEINTEDLAKEATLRAILQVLGGIPSGDDGYGLGRGRKATNLDNVWKEIPTYKNATTDIDTLRGKAVELKSTLDTLYDEGKADTVAFLKAQTELSRILTLLRNKVSKDNSNVYGEKGNKESAKKAQEYWKTYLTSGDSKLFDNLNNVSLTSVNKAKFNSKLKEINRTGNNLSDEKSKTKEPVPVKVVEDKSEKKTRKTQTPKKPKVETPTDTQQSSTQQATGGLIQLVSRLATEDTLIQVLSALHTLGTTENGITAPTAAGDLYNQFKALLLGGSIDDHERLAYMNSEAGLISGNVIGNIANISDKLIKALREKYPTAQGFDTQIHTHGKSTKPYFSKEDYQHFTKDYEFGIKKQVLLTKDSIAILDLTAVESAEEVKALMDELIKAGNSAKAIKEVFKNTESGALFETAKFDSLNANSLVKMLGAKVDVKPQEASINLDEYISKLQKYEELIKNAKTDGYLMGDDLNAKDFEDITKDIKDMIESLAKGETLTDEMVSDFEALHRRALDVGKIVETKINQNKKMYAGTKEMNSVERQYNNILASANIDPASPMVDLESTNNPKVLQEYINRYNALNTQYLEYVNNRQIYDPMIQQQLKQQAAQVQTFGKRAASSIAEAQRLQQLVDQSGFYETKDGEVKGFGGSKTLDNVEIKNLEVAMRNYVKELGQGNIENVKFNKTTQQLTYTFRINKDTVADMAVQYNGATKSLYAYNKEERESLTGMAGFIQGMKSKMKSITQYIVSITSITDIFRYLKQGVTYIQEVDSALTELKKVTDETEETYDRFLNTAAKTADRVGSTIKEIVSSTADWSRLGFSMKEAARLAESTSVLVNVSEFQSIDDATSALTSTLQAFGYTADQSMGVVDVLNEVGNNFAISSDGIATALQDSASSLMAANNSYEQAVALIASANRVVQDPNSVGAALRTISLRLRGTSTKELEEAGEDTDGVVTSKSKLRSKIQGYTGIDILTDSGAYKSTYEILLEISKVWDDLTDMDRAGLLEMIAGG